MDTLRRPGVDEFDSGSYLDGSLLEHDVSSVLDDGTVHVDGAPSFRTEAITSAGVMCRSCSLTLAQANGYGPPEVMTVAYQGFADDPEEVLPLRTPDGLLISIADYSLGRAYFEPGEPRTAPCTHCGSETLISAAGYDDGQT